ncbi:MAG: hypothetical protein AABX47_08230 [Nanoarchaeota archaeon]
MSTKIKLIFTNVRVIVFLIFVLLAIVAIHPSFGVEGVAIRNVLSNSSASDAGISSPKASSNPMSREVITMVDNIPIKDMSDWERVVADMKPNRTYTLRTENGPKSFYRISTRFKTEETPTGRLINMTESVVKEFKVNGSLVNRTVNQTVKVNETRTVYLGMEDMGLRVYEAPTNNLRKGLDIQGGTRVLLQPETQITSDEMGLLIDSLKERLNVFGLSDVIVREASDLSGNQYVLVEIAGANEEEVKELLAKQGKFEARIANQTVFRGGTDITYVCRTAQCSGLDSRAGCGQTQGGYACRFQFAISLNPDAAQRQADATRSISVTGTGTDRYLSEPIVLFLDNKEVDRLNIAEELRGRPVTDISISGSGMGKTQSEAVATSLENMRRLQTILITGSLPVKLNVVQTSNISPVVGEAFLKNSILVGLLAILAVSLVILIRYRRWDVSLPILMTCAGEVALILGFAAIVGWNLDMAAIAGIIVSIGTGVDHQIVIADETLHGERERLDWKRRLKAAMFIITSAYVTVCAAMTPLLFGGAGLLKGFALVTIAGFSFGVFISRPAFAAMVEILVGEEAR